MTALPATTHNRAGLAAFLIMSAMAWFGLIDNFVRLVAEGAGLWQFQLMRGVVALVGLGAIALVTGYSLKPKRRRNVYARSVVSSGALVLYFACLGIMPIAQAVAGLFTSPIWVILISVVFFGEKVGPRRIFAVVIGFTGAVLALGGGAGELSLVSLLPILAGAAYATGNMATRRWCEGETTLSLLTGYTVMITVWGAVGLMVVTWMAVPDVGGPAGYVTRGWVAPVGVFLVLIFVHGFGSLLGVGLTIRAYQAADATFVSVFENTLLVFATIWAAVLWGEFPTPLMIVGLLMIAASGIIIAIRTDSPPMARTDNIVE